MQDRFRVSWAMSLYSLFCFRGGNCAGRDWSSALGLQGLRICSNCMSSRAVIFSLCVSAEEKHSFSRTLLIWETLFPCSLLRLYWCEWSCWAASSFFMKLWLLMYYHKGLHNTKQRWKLRCQAGESSEQSGFLCSYLCWYNCTVWISGDNWDISVVFFECRALHDSTLATFLQA